MKSTGAEDAPDECESNGCEREPDGMVKVTVRKGWSKPTFRCNPCRNAMHWVYSEGRERFNWKPLDK